MICDCGCGEAFTPRKGARPQRFAQGHRLDFYKRTRKVANRAAKPRRPRVPFEVHLAFESMGGF